MHSIQLLLCRAYEAYDTRNLNVYLEACSADFFFRGTVVGRERVGVEEITRKVLPSTDGSFHEEVGPIFANDRYGVVLAKHSFGRDGVIRSYYTAPRLSG
jgi:hypothetical protein